MQKILYIGGVVLVLQNISKKRWRKFHQFMKTYIKNVEFLPKLISIHVFFHWWGLKSKLKLLVVFLFVVVIVFSIDTYFFFVFSQELLTENLIWNNAHVYSDWKAFSVITLNKFENKGEKRKMLT